MAAFQRLFRASVAPAAVIGGTMYFAAPTVAFADDTGAPSGSVYPGRAANGDKLPIYNNPTDEGTVTLIVHHHPLSEHIATAREATAEAVGSVRGYAEKGVSRWIDFERSVEREVKQVVPKDENLTPGIIYVLVAGLTGSVITRTRSFPVRFLAPPLFVLAAMPYFLPKTSHNLRAYLSDVEDKNFPDFAAKHDQFNSNIDMHWQIAMDRLRGVTHDANSWGSKAAQSVESATGIRVKDALSRGQQGIDKAKAKMADAAGSVRDQLPASVRNTEPKTEDVVLKKVGTVVEQKPIAEIVEAVPASEAPVEAPKTAIPAKVAEQVKPADEGKRLV